MNITSYIQDIQVHLIQTHARVFDWFHEPTAVKHYRPVDQGWTIAEILEHIALTSHYLLILIDKGTDKALRNVQGRVLSEVLDEFDYQLDRLHGIGRHKSFPWIRPEHMEPKGEKSELDIKAELISQLQRCLAQLDRLKNGEGLLYETTMTVNQLGKLNVYEYIHFLSQHAERHLQQMEENRAEFTAGG